MNKHLASFLLLISLGLVWSLGYTIARYCMTHGVPALGYSFWQSLGPAFVLGLILILFRIPFPCSKTHLRHYLLCAILGIALPNSIMYLSAAHLPSGLLAVIVNTVPILTYPLAMLAKQEKFQFSRVLALALGCIGIGILIFPHPFVFESLMSSFSSDWISFAFIAPLCFASCSVWIASEHLKPSNPLSLSFGMLLFSIFFLFPTVKMTHSFYAFHESFTRTDWLILIEIGLSSLGYVLFFALLKRAGSVYYSMVGGVVAIAGLGFGKLFYHETFHLWMYIGFLLILTAIGLLSFKSLKK